MKKNLFYIGALVLGLTMAAGCSNEEGLEQGQSKNTVLAVIENTTARTAVTDDYKVVWSENDAFTVWGASDKKGTMTLTGSAGSSTGAFTGVDNLEEGDIALFPAADTKTYTYQSSYTTTETDAPLLGTYSGSASDGGFTFSHLAAMIRVSASNLPAGQAVLTITSENQALTGVATLNDDHTLSVPAGEGKQITVTFTATEGADLKFDAPIPAQDYTKLTLELKVGENTIVKKERALNAVVGHLYELTTSYVASADALKKALAEEGGAVQLTQNMTLSEPLSVEENTVINLAGNTLDMGSNTIQVTEGKSLTIQNSSDITARNAASPSITSSNDIITASSNSTIIIGEGVHLTSTANCCVFIPQNTSNVKITTAGELKSLSTQYATIQAGGTATNITVNIVGGSVTGTCEGVYFPCTTDLNISGGTITGTTAVYHKSGKLNISGGKLIGTGDKVEYVHSGNGCGATGDALVIEACDYPGGVPVVSITNGEFISTNNKAIGYYQESEDYKLANENFITGGTFSDPSACYYLGTNADVTVKMTKDYEGAGFMTKSGQKVTMTLESDVKYNVTEPLVGSSGTKSQAFHFEKGSTVSIKGGTLTSSVSRMFMQNYADLTLEGVTLNPSIPEGTTNKYYYVLSNNCGTVNINSGTNIIAPTSDDLTVYAMDVCNYHASYPNLTVTVDEEATITGDIEYTGSANHKLILNGTHTGDLVVAEAYQAAAVAGGIVINGENWAPEVEETKPVVLLNTTDATNITTVSGNKSNAQAGAYTVAKDNSNVIEWNSSENAFKINISTGGWWNNALFINLSNDAFNQMLANKTNKYKLTFYAKVDSEHTGKKLRVHVMNGTGIYNGNNTDIYYRMLPSVTATGNVAGYYPEINNYSEYQCYTYYIDFSTNVINATGNPTYTGEVGAERAMLAFSCATTTDGADFYIKDIKLEEVIE